MASSAALVIVEEVGLFSVGFDMFCVVILMCDIRIDWIIWNHNIIREYRIRNSEKR